MHGADRGRTGDLYLAKVALSQLSYCPITNGRIFRNHPGRHSNRSRNYNKEGEMQPDSGGLTVTPRS